MPPGFIELGIMDKLMAKYLLKAGYNLTVAICNEVDTIIEKIRHTTENQPNRTQAK